MIVISIILKIRQVLCEKLAKNAFVKRISSTVVVSAFI